MGDVVAGPWVLPEGWRWDFARNVLPLEYGKALRAGNRLDGTVQVFGSAGKVGVHDCSLCDEPALIVGRKGSAGSVYYADQPSFAIDTAFFCRRSCASIDLRYGFYFLQFAKLGSLDQSTAVPSLSRDSYDRVLVPVPDPERQSKISSRIDVLFNEIDDGEAALARARADLEVYRRALLKAAVTGELTADWRAANPARETGAELLARILADRRARWHAEPKNKGKAYKEPARAKQTVLPELPSGWTYVTLEQLCRASRPISYGVLQPDKDVTSGVLLVRIMDINDGRIAVDQLKRISPEIASNYPRTRLFGGEVLMSIVGTIGRTAVVPPELAGGNTARAVAVLPIAYCRPAWVQFALGHEPYRAALEGASHEVARKTLNLEDVRPFPIPVPPKAEQIELLQRLNELLKIAVH